jgi:hypothetical protein
MCRRHVPFEFVGKVASTGAMAEASDIEGGSRSRHGRSQRSRIKGRGWGVKRSWREGRKNEGGEKRGTGYGGPQRLQTRK